MVTGTVVATGTAASAATRTTAATRRGPTRPERTAVSCIPQTSADGVEAGLTGIWGAPEGDVPDSRVRGSSRVSQRPFRIASALRRIPWLTILPVTVSRREECFVKIRILCTLGPASMDPATIGRLAEAGVDLFRINLSHTAIEDLEAAVALVQSSTDVPLCLDTEGPQVRCGPMADGVVLRKGRIVELTRDAVVGTAERIGLRPPDAFPVLQPGTRMTIDFDGALLEVVGSAGRNPTAVVLESGRVRSNKAVLLEGSPIL